MRDCDHSQALRNPDSVRSTLASRSLMRVLFLDFDGVLNADSTDVPEGTELWTEAWLVPALVVRASQIAQRTGARTVICSSWRQLRSLSDLRAMLAGLGYVGEVIDVTPRLP